MPPPVPESPVSAFWSSVAEGDSSLMGWYDAARVSVNSVMDKVDDTVNAIAEAVDDTIAAYIGDDDPVAPGPSSQYNPTDQDDSGGSGDEKPAKRNAGASASASAKKKDQVGKDDDKERNVIWPVMVSDICLKGDLEEFVLKVRGYIKEDSDEVEFGEVLSNQLLDEVTSEAILRILHVMQAVVSDGNLTAATEVIRARCGTKLTKLQASGSMFGKVAADVLGDRKVKKRPKGEASETAPEATAKANGTTAAPAGKTPPPPPPPADLLDMMDVGQVAPATASAAATPAAAAAPSAAAKPNVQDDLLFGFGGTSGAAPSAVARTTVPVLAPPPAVGASAASRATPAFKNGDLVTATWDGDGKRYPAIVDRLIGSRVTVRWMRRSATSSPSEAFVSEVGDDGTHEGVMLADLQPYQPGGLNKSTAAAKPSQNLDFLDFDNSTKSQAQTTSLADADIKQSPVDMLGSLPPTLDMTFGFPAAAPPSGGALPASAGVLGGGAAASSQGVVGCGGGYSNVAALGGGASGCGAQSVGGAPGTIGWGGPSAFPEASAAAAGSNWTAFSSAAPMQSRTPGLAPNAMVGATNSIAGLGGGCGGFGGGCGAGSGGTTNTSSVSDFGFGNFVSASPGTVSDSKPNLAQSIDLGAKKTGSPKKELNLGNAFDLANMM
eukprot:TRINITY_DN26215_c0_g1_i2.p1 TRINITY_DN26215_c0_g1~~TRINITY_DN26215_c0_g1_i2.p1  ORF type:complete len:740 (-),score=185.05 TRINITY_DN26215_c0_g1_i2:174-2165(-)